MDATMETSPSETLPNPTNETDPGETLKSAENPERPKNDDGGQPNLASGTAQGETAFDENRPKSPPEKCAICLSAPENRSYTDSCYHEFCFVCLLEWSKVKAECPLCKQKFKNIIHNIRSMSDYDEYEVKPTSSTSAASAMGAMNTNVNLDNFGYDELGNRFRYNSTMTAERLELIRHIRELQNRLNSLRQTQENEYRVRRERERLQRLHHLYRRSANRPESFTTTIEFRRMIYERGLRVRTDDVTEEGLVYREANPQFYSNNPAQMHRLMRWLHRELNVFFNGRSERVNFVTEFICYLLTRYEITSQEFKHRLGVILLQNTDHFVHEFYNFARSPYEMEQYDRRARYERPAPTSSAPRQQDLGQSTVQSASSAATSAPWAPPQSQAPSDDHVIEPITLSPSPSPSSSPVSTPIQLGASSSGNRFSFGSTNDQRLERYRCTFETTLANLRRDVNSAKARLNGLRIMNNAIQSFLINAGAAGTLSSSTSSSQSQPAFSISPSGLGPSTGFSRNVSALNLSNQSLPTSSVNATVDILSDDDPGSSSAFNLFAVSPRRHISVSSDSSSSSSEESDGPIIDNTILINDCLLINETRAEPIRVNENVNGGQSPRSTYLSSGASSPNFNYSSTAQRQDTEVEQASDVSPSFRRTGVVSRSEAMLSSPNVSRSPSPPRSPGPDVIAHGKDKSNDKDESLFSADENEEAIFSSPESPEDDNESLEVVDQPDSPMSLDWTGRKNNLDDVEVVAVLKPKSMRTPEVIKIDSDSDIDQSGSPAAAEADESQLDDRPCCSKQFIMPLKWRPLATKTDQSLSSPPRPSSSIGSEAGASASSGGQTLKSVVIPTKNKNASSKDPRARYLNRLRKLRLSKRSAEKSGSPSHVDADRRARRYFRRPHGAQGRSPSTDSSDDGFNRKFNEGRSHRNKSRYGLRSRSRSRSWSRSRSRSRSRNSSRAAGNQLNPSTPSPKRSYYTQKHPNSQPDRF